MRFSESEMVELKWTVVDEIKKEVVAFADSNGEILYIGIADNGDVVGLDEPCGVLVSVNNMLRDTIKPDVTLLAQSNVENIESKSVVSVTVQRGTKRPYYYIGGKSLRPEGVYVKHGTASVPATNTAIRRCFLPSTPFHFDCYDRTCYETVTICESIALFSIVARVMHSKPNLRHLLCGKHELLSNLIPVFLRVA